MQKSSIGVRTLVLALAMAASSSVVSGATLYKVTGQIGDNIGHTTADGNVPQFGDFTFYFGTGAIPNYVGIGSIEGDFTSGFRSIGYLQGMLDVEYINTTANGFAIINTSELTEWHPDENKLTLDVERLAPYLSVQMILQFAPGFTGNGPAILTGSSFNVMWNGFFQGRPQFIESWYHVASATVSVVPADPGAGVPEPGSAPLFASGFLLILAGGWFQRHHARKRAAV